MFVTVKKNFLFCFVCLSISLAAAAQKEKTDAYVYEEDVLTHLLVPAGPLPTALILMEFILT